MEDEPTLRPTLPGLRSLPAVPPALAVLAGTALGRGMVYAPVGALAALALLGVALASGRGSGRRGAARTAGVVLAVLSLSLVNAQVRGRWRGPLPEAGRPVTAIVETTGHWRRLGEIWSAPVRVVRLSQGRRVVGGRDAGLDPVYLNLASSSASEGPPAPYGTRLRVKGFLDRPVPLGNPPPRPPGPWRLKVKSSRLVAVTGTAGPLDRLAGRLREAVEAGLRRAAELRSARTEEEAPEGLGLPLARALVLGDASRVPPRVVRGLRRLGLAHVLAVSGLHVGLVAGLVLLLAGPLPPSARWALSLAAVVLYLFLVGPRPSLVRASSMAVLVVVALLAERPPSALNALAVVAAAIALERPAAVAEVGFQLSVGATAGLLCLGPVLSRRWSAEGGASVRLPERVREALAVSVGAQLGTLPWALPLFALMVPAAPLVNLVAVPWTLVTLTGAGLWTGLATLSPGAAAALLPGLDLLAAPFALPAAVPASPWASLPLASGPVAATLLALLLCAAFARPRVGLPVVVLAWIALAGLADRLPRPPKSGVELVVLDVGQGDAILLRDGGRTLLVDGGGWPAGDLGGRVLLPALARRGVRRLDRMLLTHGDRDHCGGLVELASYLAVDEVLTGPGGPGGSCDAELRRLPGVAHRTVTAGEGLRVGRWRVRVLHAGGVRSAGDNDGSVVALAEAFGRRILLTGDVEAAGERRLVRGAPSLLPCQVLKVAHHGSRSSSTEGFLRAASPSLALVSAGARNPYGHPAPEVLDRLRHHGARVLRTDRDGMIVLRLFPDGRWGIDLPGAPKR